MSTTIVRTPADRLQGVTAFARERAERARRSIAQNDLVEAARMLDEALTEHPEHAELLMLRGICEHHQGRAAQAIALLRRAQASRPDDALIEANLGAALAQHGDIDAAVRAFARATELDPALIDAWFNLARALEQRGDAAGALAAFSAVIELDPRNESARVLRAEALKTLGRIGEAEDELRAMLREDPHTIAAWIALINLKSYRANADDLATIARLLDGHDMTPTQRIDLSFAYASALEAHGDTERAFAEFERANRAKRATLRWNAAAVTKLVDAILVAFAGASAPDTSSRGEDVVFLVGMARSGSTLAEQILAAHPAVSAGGETGLVSDLLQAESQRRTARFPTWVTQATPQDWRRLGEDYLARIAPLRRPGTAFTDKTLTNWQTLGAIRRMLPSARIVHCVRDPLETAWSCYKHNFEQQTYSYDIAELAAFFGDCERAMREWNARDPHWIHPHRHESLLENPEHAVRALLAHCGLPFDPACLRFHEVEREVRTASAAQVRRPLQARRSVAERYGALLDPLRLALGIDGSARS